MTRAHRRQLVLARLVAASAQLQLAHAEAKRAGLVETVRQIDQLGEDLANAISRAQSERERVRA